MLLSVLGIKDRESNKGIIFERLAEAAQKQKLIELINNVEEWKHDIQNDTTVNA